MNKTKIINDIKFTYPREEEFEKLYQEIFIDKQYKFITSNKSPFIIDAGSHIGVSVLYFKTLYPHAKILAFEPNPETFEILKENINQNNLKGVKLYNCAIADKNGSSSFFASKDAYSWTWNNSLVNPGDFSNKNYKTIKTTTTSLSPFIDKKIDMLKVDVQGTETVALNAIVNKLSLVQNIILEYHGKSREPVNDGSSILKVLKNANFVTSIIQNGKNINESEFIKNDYKWVLIRGTKQTTTVLK